LEPAEITARKKLLATSVMGRTKSGDSKTASVLQRVDAQSSSRSNASRLKVSKSGLPESAEAERPSSDEDDIKVVVADALAIRG